MDFKEYEKEHPEAQPLPDYILQEQKAEQIRILTRQETEQTVKDLKENIQRQLEEGNAPQYILYSAVQIIGLLTQDPEWSDNCKAQLDAVYADLAQQSFIFDNETIAAARLEEMKEKYNAKLRKQLTLDLYGYRNIEKSIKTILQSLDELETAEEE